MSRGTSPIRKTILVAWREFRFTALTPAFLIGVVAVPIALLGLLAIYPILLAQEARPLEGTLVLVDPSGEVASQVEEIIEKGDLFSEAAEKVADMMSGLPGGMGDDNNPVMTTTEKVHWLDKLLRTDEQAHIQPVQACQAQCLV